MSRPQTRPEPVNALVTGPEELMKTLDWHTLDQPGLEEELGVDRNGLTEKEAAERLQKYGPNQLQEEPPINPALVLLHQFTSPLIYILMIAAVVTLAIGEYIDSLAIAAVLMLNAVIGFTQEYRAESASRALRQMVTPKARVIRDGHVKTVDSKTLVQGDVVLLESGDRVPADLRLFDAHSLNTQEAALTGESVPVTKSAKALAQDLGIADRTNLAYAGTVVSSGRGHGFVIATGNQTEIGKIARDVREAKTESTPLQDRMDRFAKVIGVIVGLASLAAIVIGLVLGHDLVDMFMLAVALAVAAIPEGLPIVFTITLSVGVSRMAARHAIVRKLPAVETLGSTTVIGSDKTGTLTQNRMTVEEVYTASGSHLLGSDGAVFEPGTQSPVERLIVAGVLANEAHVRIDGDDVEVEGDPTEAALLIAAHRLGLQPEQLRRDHAQVAEIPFESEKEFMASFRRYEGGTAVFVKGSPGKTVAMSNTILGLAGPEPIDRERLLEEAKAMAAKGLRVLGMAYRPNVDAPDSDAPETPRDLIFLGFQGMIDPPREEVREAIEGAHEAGIRVLMITGDHAVTATAIGSQLGIVEPDAGDKYTVTGRQLDEMSDEELREVVKRVAIFARVSPQHKLRVVQALRENGEVVGVTGDGVNDAPALKAADIGIAMGKGGTDVAREASDMVLTDDNFASIYAAVEEGRVTFDNLRKATFFLISTGAASILVILGTLFAGWPLPLLPAQLLWMNLVTNGLQDVALAFEPGEKDIAKRSPRRRDEGVISPLLWERTAVAGVVMAIGTIYVFWWVRQTYGEGPEMLPLAQTSALTTMVLFQTFQAWNARSERRSIFRINPFTNPFLLGAVVVALAVHTLALYWQPLQFILRVVALPGEVWLRMVLVATSILVAMEIHKLLRKEPIRRAEHGGIQTSNAPER